MMHAYDKIYLEKARAALGRMLDFAVYELKYDASDFFGLFIKSGVARRFESGDFTLLVGMSGIELAYEVLSESQIPHERIKPRFSADRSEEYWAGQALAYYQWATSLSFADIVKYVPLAEIIALYSPYHEMDIRHFVDRMNELYNTAKPETNLKLLRKSRNMTQSELSRQSGVPLRTIQQYEQRRKSINKAQAESLVMISRVLCCDIAELLELTSD